MLQIVVASVPDRRSGQPSPKGNLCRSGATPIRTYTNSDRQWQHTRDVSNQPPTNHQPSHPTLTTAKLSVPLLADLITQANLSILTAVHSKL